MDQSSLALVLVVTFVISVSIGFYVAKAIF